MLFKKTAAFALALAAMSSMILSSCAPKKDAVIATVGEDNIYKWELDLIYDQNAPQYEAQRGFDLSSPKFKDERIKYRQFLAEKLAGELACLQEAKKLGLDQLSEEELAATDAEYQELRNQNISEYMKEFASDKDPAARAEEKWQKTMTEKSLSEEKVKLNINNNKILQKLFDKMAQGHIVTDEEAREKYQELLEAQHRDYAENPALFGQQATGIICYIPEGYIRVKHILIGHSEEKLAQLQQEQQDLYQLYSLWAQAAITDGDDSRAAVDAAKDMEEAEAAFTKNLDENIAALLPSAEEAYARASAGEDFDSLIEQYNTDPGMQMLPGRRDGYYMHTSSDFVEEFKEGAFALENVGDISPLIKSFYGYHVVKLLEKVSSREVPFEEVEERIRFELQGNRNIDAGMEITLKLVNDRDVKYFPENF